jgi:glycosyltransferase involved in cell wall biosynthesis
MNVSAIDNLQGDSGFRVQFEFMKACWEAGKDYFFYFIAPPEAERLIDLPNCLVLPYRFQHFHYWSRFDFDFERFAKLIDQNRFDIDLLWNNQPELTPQLLALLRYKCHFDTPAVGYLHWLEIPEARSGAFYGFEQAFYQELAGILCSEFVGTHGEWTKNIWLKHLYELGLPEMKLNLHPLTLGTDISAYDAHKNTDRFDMFTVLFNHRNMTYTGFKKMTEILEKYEFENVQFLFTNPGQSQIVLPPKNRNTIKFLGSLPRDEYLSLLWKVDMGVALHPQYSPWGLSCVDLMACGKPSLVPNALSFPEVFGKDYQLMFNSEKEFVEKLRYVSENPSEYRKWSNYVYDRCRSLYDWKVLLPKWCEVVERGLNFERDAKTRTEKSETLPEIADYIKRFKLRRKQDILDYKGWRNDSNQPKWNPYRRGLQGLGIYEDIENPEVVFYGEKVPEERKKMGATTKKAAQTLGEW